MPKQYKLDLFKLLDNISRKNVNYYNTLSDEEKKEISPLILMRWLSGTTDARQIFFLNELVNPFVFNMGKHKELLINLMTLCTSGKPKRYKFKKRLSKKIAKLPKTTMIIKNYFKYNTLDAIAAIPLISDDDILSIAYELGVQKPDITIIKRELKTRNKK